MTKNNIAIDYLRAFITVLVVAHHAVIAYATFVPPVTTAFATEPYLWAPFPVVDSQRWVGFDLFLLFNDTFFMSLMFLLAGLFVWPSIARKGGKAYLRDRCLRLGLPFVVVGILLIPIAYYPSYLLRGGIPDGWTYLQEWIALSSWPGGPCWFIATLLVLDLLAVLLHRFAPGWVETLGKLCSGAEQRPPRLFLGLMVISIIAYSTMRYTFDPFRWFSFGPFAIQASRVLLYPTYFFAGVAIGVWGIDRGLLARDGALARYWAAWIVVAVLAFASFVFFSVQLRTPGLESSLPLNGMGSVSRVLSCGAISFALLAVFVRFANRRMGLLDSFSANAYGIYLIHYFFISWTQYALLDSPLPAIPKAAIVFFSTVVLSWGLVAGVRLIPSINRILFSGARLTTAVER